MHIGLYVCLLVYIYMNTEIHTHTHIEKKTFIFIYIHTYTHIHTVCMAALSSFTLISLGNLGFIHKSILNGNICLKNMATSFNISGVIVCPTPLYERTVYDFKPFSVT
jgi:hypothetical protein